MTWQNIPCPPAIAAISAVCPLGWVEVVFEFHPGNLASDPPQDADCSQRLGRVWGVDGSDLDDIMDQHGRVLAETPPGTPSSDYVLLLRVEHVAAPCNTCGRTRSEDDTGWSCTTPDGDKWPEDACTGVFPLAVTLCVGWGIDGQPVLSLLPVPRYA